MTPNQARVLVAILHRLAADDSIAHEQIKDFADLIGAYSDLNSASIVVGAPDVGRPTLTIHEETQ